MSYPCFLNIGKHLWSLGPLLLVVAVGIFVVVNAMKTDTELTKVRSAKQKARYDRRQKSLNQIRRSQK